MATAAPDAAAAATAAPAPAAAAGDGAVVVVARPNFTGTWVAERSENFSKFLEAVGVPWVKRKAAAGNQHSQANCLVKSTAMHLPYLQYSRLCSTQVYINNHTRQ